MCVMRRMGCSCRRSRMYVSSTIRLRFLDDEALPLGVVEGIRDGEDVFVAAARVVDEDAVVGRELPRLFERLDERVGGFERGDEALLAHGQRERVGDLGVGR